MAGATQGLKQAQPQGLREALPQGLREPPPQGWRQAGLGARPTSRPPLRRTM